MNINKKESLQTIINAACVHGVWVSDYNMTIPDGVDEKDGGGAWDMAGDIADYILRGLYETAPSREYDGARDKIQSLLYGFICDYKDEKETNDE